MTADRLRECLDALNWSQRGLATLLGLDDRQVRRWAAGARIPEHVAEWLEELGRFHEKHPPPNRRHEMTTGTEEVTRIEHGVRVSHDKRGADYVETGRCYYVVICTEDDVLENEDFDTEDERDAFIERWHARYPRADVVRKREALSLI